MKSLLMVCFFCLITAGSFSQDTVYIQPGPEDGKDARLNEHQPYLNFGGSVDFLSYYWTFSGNPAKGVSLIQFDLSEIPSQMIILDAKLSLYHNPGSTSAGQAGENASYLKKITSYWDEYNVTWNSMPGTTLNGAVYLSTSVNANQDYLDIDLTDIVSEWHESPENNFGLMLEILQPSLYRSMLFASSDCLEESLRPMLMVVYAKEAPVENCITIQPGPEDGMDARLHGYYPDQNFGDVNEFLSYYWTFDGYPAPGYSIVKFDLSEIPENVIVTGAWLSLSHIVSPSAGQSGENECYLRKVIEPWDEHTVTWNNMPEITTENEVFLEQSVTADQNYSDIDITAFVDDWYSNPEQNYGMMLQIVDFILYRSMKFASSDCVIEDLRPSLRVCFESVSNNSVLQSNSISVCPNPSNGLFNVFVPDNMLNSEFNIIDITGKIISTIKIVTSQQYIDLNSFPNGVYFLKSQTPSDNIAIKLIKM